MHTMLAPARAAGPYVIKVEMWYESDEDPLALEWCGEFIWGVEFVKGPHLIFDHPSEALEFITQQGTTGDIAGFEYRYRVLPDEAYQKYLGLPF